MFNLIKETHVFNPVGLSPGKQKQPFLNALWRSGYLGSLISFRSRVRFPPTLPYVPAYVKAGGPRNEKAGVPPVN